MFADIIEELLKWCGLWPEPQPVLIMDNANFHRTARIDHLCYEAGVKVLYLPPSSPDLNPIEEFFEELINSLTSETGEPRNRDKDSI